MSVCCNILNKIQITRNRGHGRIPICSLYSLARLELHSYEENKMILTNLNERYTFYPRNFLVCVALGLSMFKAQAQDSQEPAPSAPPSTQMEDFSPKNDQGLAPLRPCYTKWIRRIDNATITELELVRIARKKCSKETQTLIERNLSNGMLGSPGNLREANSTIDYWAGGVVRWLRNYKK